VMLKKTKSKRVADVRKTDGRELSERALEETNNNNNNTVAYKADAESSKCIDIDNDSDKSKFCNNSNSTNNTNNNGNYGNNNFVPLEIDTHFQMYGKHVWEVEYGERCPLCNKKIDEYGLCACGSGGE
jgi:hypothetical protein